MTAKPSFEEHGPTMAEFDPTPYLQRIARPSMEPGKRVRNRALLIDESGGEHELTSGNDDRYFAHAVRLAAGAGYVQSGQIPAFAAHVDVKAALWMQLHEQCDVRLVTDTATCVGPLSCNTALAGVVPDWARLPADPTAPPSIAAYFQRDHDLAPQIIHSREGIDLLLERLARQPFENSVAALYLIDRPRNRRGLPDHELRVGVDGQTGRAALRYMGGNGTWYSQGWTSSRDEVCFYYMGNETPFPKNSELSLDEASDAIGLFFGKNGIRPENIAWAPVDPPPPLVDQQTKTWWGL